MKSTNLYSTFSCIIVIEEKNRLSKGAPATTKDWMNAERSGEDGSHAYRTRHKTQGHDIFGYVLKPQAKELAQKISSLK